MAKPKTPIGPRSTPRTRFETVALLEADRIADWRRRRKRAKRPVKFAKGLALGAASVLVFTKIAKKLGI